MRMNVDMPDELYREFSEYCAEKNVSRSSMVRYLIKAAMVRASEEAHLEDEDEQPVR